MIPAGTHKPRLARTVTILFLAVAVLPLGVCAAILFGKFNEQVNQTQIDHFDETLRTFGNTVMGRLISADDVLTSLVNAPGATGENVATQLHPVDWLQEAQLVAEGEQPPAPLSSAARSSLAAGKSILTWRVDGSQPSVYLAHRLGNAGVLFAQIKTRWLWDDAPNFAGKAYLGIMDDEGRTLASSGEVAPPKTLAIQADGGRDSHQLAVDKNLNGRAWDLFLGSQFSAPSWRLVMVSAKPTLFANQNGQTYLYLLGFLVLTILGMSWVSMVAIRRQLQPLRVLSRATQRLAQREFDAFQGLHWENEFGELANSFRNMAAKLKLQFGVLDSLSDVDRQLLNAPRLESILEALLPQVADLLACETVSLVLFDSRGKTARGFDYVRSKIKLVTARPIELSDAVMEALENATAGNPSAQDLVLLRSILPSEGKPLLDVQVQSLGKEGVSGVLCLGYAEQSRPGSDATLTAEDFADRLTLVLANLNQAETLRQQAHYDALTGLENRERFAANAAAAVSHASSSGSQGYLLYIDLDQFKHVNDTAGHAAGDELLKVVANRIRGCISAHHVARLGGDEFAVLAPQVASADEALLQAQRIIAALERDIEIDGRHHRISASIGIGLFPTHAQTVDELLKAGDIAMYIAKAAGRGRAQVFQPDMQQRLNEQVRMEKQLLEALDQNEFVLHYQPIVDESVGSVAAEALVRWANPRTGEQVPPAKFVPVAEANGLIVRLGDWILRHACRQYAAWRDLGIHLTYISVNVSVRQLQEPNYCDGLMAALRQYGLRADQLQIEVTESVLAHEGSIRPTLERIASLGVRLALDDFGTGYSSLSYLRTFPIHSVKIDRSFVMELPHDSVSCQLTSSIIAMCLALGKKVTAEGVETPAQRSYLRGLGCTSIQGYLLARPMESIDIPGFVMRLRETAAPSEPRHRRATAQ